MTHNKIWLSFCIYWNTEEVTHKEISDFLQIEPSKIWVKGQPKVKPGSPIVWPGNKWMFDASTDKQMPFEDQMELMLDVIEAKKDKFKAICDKYYCEFSLGLYCYTNREESTPSVHLSKRYHKVTGDFEYRIRYRYYFIRRIVLGQYPHSVIKSPFSPVNIAIQPTLGRHNCYNNSSSV